MKTLPSIQTVAGIIVLALLSCSRPQTRPSPQNQVAALDLNSKLGEAVRELKQANTPEAQLRAASQLRFFYTDYLREQPKTNAAWLGFQFLNENQFPVSYQRFAELEQARSVIVMDLRTNQQLFTAFEMKLLSTNTALTLRAIIWDDRPR